MIGADRDKRLALAISIGFHVVVFSALAMSGVFTFLQQKTQDRPIDVTVYQQNGTDDGDVTSSAPAGDSAPGGGSSSPAAPTYTVPQQKSLPSINESYTNAAQEARSVAAAMSAQRGTAPTAPANTSHTATTGAPTGTGPSTASGGAKGSDTAGQPTGNGDSTGNGKGNETDSGNGTDTSQGNGNGGSDSTGPAAETPGRRPAKNAHAIYTPDPSSYYPESLRRKNITAVVVVQFIVGPDGSVTSASVATSSGYPAADDAAVRLVSAYRYSPAENEYGQPVSAEGTQTVRFSLE